jgi:septum formation protein
MDASDGVAMLMQLSGRVHEVMTGVTVSGNDRRLSQVVISTVAFKSFDQTVAERYWATGEPVDKAGGYAIQGLGSSFVEHLTGSYSNVMGLPLFETAAMLEQMGVDLF